MPFHFYKCADFLYVFCIRLRKELQAFPRHLKITYDPEADVLRFFFSNASIEESTEDQAGVFSDYDKDGNAASWKF